MGEVSTIGVDIAKSAFQIHGVDADGVVVIRRRLGRAKVLEFFADLPRCLVGMEACATAHYWARELKKLGHDARLMPPTYVKISDSCAWLFPEPRSALTTGDETNFWNTSGVGLA
jgi:transposase